VLSRCFVLPPIVFHRDTTSWRSLCNPSDCFIVDFFFSPAGIRCTGMLGRLFFAQNPFSPFDRESPSFYSCLPFLGPRGLLLDKCEASSLLFDLAAWASSVHEPGPSPGGMIAPLLLLVPGLLKFYPFIRSPLSLPPKIASPLPHLSIAALSNRLLLRRLLSSVVFSPRNGRDSSWKITDPTPPPPFPDRTLLLFCVERIERAGASPPPI